MTLVEVLRRLLPYAWRRRGAMAAVALAMLAEVVVTLLLPWPMKVLVDNALGGHPLPAWLHSVFVSLPGPATRQALLWWSAAATVLLFILQWAVGLALAWTSVRFGQRLSYDLAGDLFDHLQRLSLRFHARSGVGNSMRRITGDSTCVATITGEALLPAAVAVASLLGMLVVMWLLDPVLTLVALAVVPTMVLGMRRFTRPMLERSYEQQVAEGQMYDTIEHTLSGLPAVQAFGQEPAFDERFRANNERTLAATVAMTWAQFRFKILIGAATALGTAAIFWLGASHTLSGSLTVGSLLVFLTYLGSLYGPLHTLSYSQSSVTEAAGSARRVFEVLDAPVEVGDGSDPARPAVDPGRVVGEVVFEGVSFGYEPGRRVLEGVSFEARRGEVVAIVGATGAGKSTLVSLVPRFMDPDQGRVLLDGRDLRELRLEGVRRNVSLVLQESFLFPFSIEENIAFGRPGASREEVEAAARAANAHEFICRLPQRYETVVGERGATLSGGERQRVAIARALLKDAPVLILDEPTSSLDAKTEALLLGALERLMVGRTTLIIAHRLSTIRHADHIIVLDHGRIVEQGTQQQLLRNPGAYQELYALQHRPPAVPA